MDSFDPSPPPQSEEAACPKLRALRAHMAKCNGGLGIAALIVPTEDPHMSEYIPATYARRKFISGFTGSAGTVVVTMSAALLWTDGRYFLQAESELGRDWTLMRSGAPGSLEAFDWLDAVLPPGARVGVDPYVHTLEAMRKLSALLEKGDKVLVKTRLPRGEGEGEGAEGNLVDLVWGSGRPPQPTAPLRVHPMRYAGEEVSDKITRMRAAVQERGANAFLVSALDDVAWLLNLRGSDVTYNPVFLAYVILTTERCTLFVDERKLTPEVGAHLAAAGVAVEGYESIVSAVEQLAATQGARILVDRSKVSWAVAGAAIEAADAAHHSRGRKRKSIDADTDLNGRRLEGPERDGASLKEGPGAEVLVEAPSPIAAAKAVKNAAELEGMRLAHLRDGVALAEFFCWLEDEVRGGARLTEVDLGDHLVRFRSKQEGFIEPSFASIVGSGPNGAVIHYKAKPGPQNRTVSISEMLLVDSGAQFDCGTTDVTRTVHFGEPTLEERRAATAVLKGYIGLDRAVFPEGTPGFMLDSFARHALWRLGLDYRHGTGHGVGSALNVHEGPIGIAPRFHVTHPLSAGMVLSNEPGYYEAGKFGVRIENLVEVVEASTPHKFANTNFYSFSHLTQVPIQKKILAKEDLNAEERAWLNEYHSEVLAKILPRLTDPRVKEWLQKACEPL